MATKQNVMAQNETAVQHKVVVAGIEPGTQRLAVQHATNRPTSVPWNCIYAVNCFIIILSKRTWNQKCFYFFSLLSKHDVT